MPAAYLEDFRSRVVDAVERREGSIRQVARRFKVSPSFVVRLLHRHREAGTIQPRPHLARRPLCWGRRSCLARLSPLWALLRPWQLQPLRPRRQVLGSGAFLARPRPALSRDALYAAIDFPKKIREIFFGRPAHPRREIARLEKSTHPPHESLGSPGTNAPWLIRCFGNLIGEVRATPTPWTPPRGGHLHRKSTHPPSCALPPRVIGGRRVGTGRLASVGFEQKDDVRSRHQ